MTKTELRKQLEEAYFNLLQSGMLNENFTSDDDHAVHTDDWRVMAEAEKRLYGRFLGSDEVNKKAPGKNALKRWNELKNSPLYKALS